MALTKKIKKFKIELSEKELLNLYSSARSNYSGLFNDELTKSIIDQVFKKDKDTTSMLFYNDMMLGNHISYDLYQRKLGAYPLFVDMCMYTFLNIDNGRYRPKIIDNISQETWKNFVLNINNYYEIEGIDHYICRYAYYNKKTWLEIFKRINDQSVHKILIERATHIFETSVEKIPRYGFIGLNCKEGAFSYTMIEAAIESLNIRTNKDKQYFIGIISNNLKFMRKFKSIILKKGPKSIRDSIKFIDKIKD